MADQDSLLSATTTESFDADVASGVVVVDFWAEWCGPCQVMLPRLEMIAKEVEGVARVMKCDVDSAPEVAQRFRVMSIPTLIVFKDGKPVHSWVGVQSVADVTAKIREVAA
jgi:thioredoxin 1